VLVWCLFLSIPNPTFAFTLPRWFCPFFFSPKSCVFPTISLNLIGRRCAILFLDSEPSYRPPPFSFLLFLSFLVCLPTRSADPYSRPSLFSQSTRSISVFSHVKFPSEVVSPSLPAFPSALRDFSVSPLPPRLRRHSPGFFSRDPEQFLIAPFRTSPVQASK